MEIIFESEMIIRGKAKFSVKWFDEDNGWAEPRLTPGWHKIRILDVRWWKPHQIEQDGKWYDTEGILTDMINTVKEDEEDESHYCPSAWAGDYSPSCPWNAPGMSIRDFI